MFSKYAEDIDDEDLKSYYEEDEDLEEGVEEEEDEEGEEEDDVELANINLGDDYASVVYSKGEFIKHIFSLCAEYINREDQKYDDELLVLTWNALMTFLLKRRIQGKSTLDIADILKCLRVLITNKVRSILSEANIDFYKVILPAYAQSISKVERKTELIQVTQYLIKKKDREAIDVIFNNMPTSLIDESFMNTLIKYDPNFWTIDKVLKRIVETKEEEEEVIYESDTISERSPQYQLADPDSIFSLPTERKVGDRVLRAIFNAVTRTPAMNSLYNTIGKEGNLITPKVKEKIDKTLINPLKIAFTEFMKDKSKTLGVNADLKIKIGKLEGALGKLVEKDTRRVNVLLLSIEDCNNRLRELNKPLIRVMRLFTPTVFATPDDLKIIRAMRDQHKGTYKTLVDYVIRPQVARGRNQQHCVACAYKKKKVPLEGRIQDFAADTLSDKQVDEYMGGSKNKWISGSILNTGDKFSAQYPQYNVCSPDKDGLHEILVELINDKKLRVYPDDRAIDTLLNIKVTGSSLEVHVFNFLINNKIKYTNLHSLENFKSDKHLFLREVVPFVGRKYPYDFYIPQLHLFIEVQGDQFHGSFPAVAKNVLDHFNLIKPDKIGEAIKRAEDLIKTLNTLPKSTNFEKDPELGQSLMRDYKDMVSIILSAYKTDRNAHPKSLDEVQDLKKYIDDTYLDTSDTTKDIENLTRQIDPDSKTASGLFTSKDKIQDDIKRALVSIDKGLNHVLKDHHKRHMVHSSYLMKSAFPAAKYRVIELHAKDFQQDVDKTGLKKVDAILEKRVLKELNLPMNHTISEEITKEALGDLILKRNISRL